MNKEICFKIDSKEVFLEQVLVDYNKIPIYFVCKDDCNQFYIALCTDIDEEKYIIIETQISKLRELLNQKITMRDIILSEKKFWDVLAGENVEDDICQQKDIELINIEDLPYEDSYFNVVTKSNKEFLDEVDRLFFSQMDEWEEHSMSISSSELEDLVFAEIVNRYLKYQVEIKETKSIEEMFLNCVKEIYVSYDDVYNSVEKLSQANIDCQLELTNLENNNDVLAA